MPKIYFLILFISFTSLQATPTRFDFRDALRRNSVDIVMDGPLERTVGVSHFVTGWMEVNLEAISQGFKGELEVDMRTFETGVELKNIFLREKIFEASQYPTAMASIVKAVSVSSGRLIDGQSLQVKAEAQLRFKNSVKSVIIPLRMTYYKENDFTRTRLPGNLLLVTSGFELDLATFGIVLPEAVRAASQKTVQVNTHFVGSNRLPTGAEGLPEGPKPKEAPKK